MLRYDQIARIGHTLAKGSGVNQHLLLRRKEGLHRFPYDTKSLSPPQHPKQEID
jgi:hypothetical protein